MDCWILFIQLNDKQLVKHNVFIDNDLIFVEKISIIYCRNPNSTQPNITLVGLDTKMTNHPTLPHQQKLNVSNISAVPDPILMKL